MAHGLTSETLNVWSRKDKELIQIPSYLRYSLNDPFHAECKKKKYKIVHVLVSHNIWHGRYDRPALFTIVKSVTNGLALHHLWKMLVTGKSHCYGDISFCFLLLILQFLSSG